MVIRELDSNALLFFHIQNWETKSGWRVVSSRKRCVPGDPGYPRLSDRSKHSDYATRGFTNPTL